MEFPANVWTLTSFTASPCAPRSKRQRRRLFIPQTHGNWLRLKVYYYIFWVERRLLDRIILAYVCCSDRGQHSPMQNDLLQLIRCLLWSNERILNKYILMFNYTFLCTWYSNFAHLQYRGWWEFKGQWNAQDILTHTRLTFSNQQAQTLSPSCCSLTGEWAALKIIPNTATFLICSINAKYYKKMSKNTNNELKMTVYSTNDIYGNIATPFTKYSLVPPSTFFGLLHNNW